MHETDKSWVLKLLLCVGFVVSSADVVVMVIAAAALAEQSCHRGLFPLPIWLMIACSLNIVTLIALLLSIVRAIRTEAEVAMRHALIVNCIVGISKTIWVILGIAIVSQTSGCSGIVALTIVELIWLATGAFSGVCALRYSSQAYETIE